MAVQKESPRRAETGRGDQQATTTNRSQQSQFTPLERLTQRLEMVRYRGEGNWSARCPAHDDKDPSLSIRETDEGVLLVHCFSGCATPDVLAAVGLSFRDLFPGCCPGSPGRPRGGRGLSPRRRRELEEALENERFVLRMVAADVQANKASKVDVERAGTAMDRVKKIRRLLRNG